MISKKISPSEYVCLALLKRSGQLSEKKIQQWINSHYLGRQIINNELSGTLKNLVNSDCIQKVNGLYEITLNGNEALEGYAVAINFLSTLKKESAAMAQLASL